jgi:hypothetical protein
VGLAAVVAPLLHSITDLIEWSQGGFSPGQLWLNYAAFLPMPALMIGLYAVQRPAIGQAGLWGALLYGGSFVYFAHTTLWALAEGAADYSILWGRLGPTYTIHGAVMVVGGLLFGAAAWRARAVPRVAAGLFLGGILLNLGLGLLPLPEILQAVGSGVRNAGLMLMGWHLLCAPTASRRPADDGGE